jgi:hypothetical protein
MHAWQLFPKVAKAVQAAHETCKLCTHHDFAHSFRVAEIAMRTAEAEWEENELTRLSALAGLVHSADHVLQKMLQTKNIADHRIVKLIQGWIGNEVIGKSFEIVCTSVLQHSQRNGNDDHRVLIALMDGDRVVNLDLDLVMRSAQMFSDSPTVDSQYWIEDPVATYKEPLSVIRDVAYALDWVNPTSPVCIRTALAMEMAQPRAMLLQGYIDSLSRQLVEESVFPYPFKPFGS